MKTLIYLILISLSSVSFAYDLSEAFDFDFDPSLEGHFAKAIDEGLVTLNEEGSLALFYNSRINKEYQRKILGLQVGIREELFSSKEVFMCVNNYLSGFPTEPGKSEEKVVLEKHPLALEVVDSVGVFVERKNGKREVKDHFIRIKHIDGKQYWVKKSVTNKKTGEVLSFVTKFSDCSKIQEDIENYRYEQVSKEARASIPRRSSRLQYVCTKNDPLGASETTKLKREHMLVKGSEVALLQGTSATPFTDDKGDEFIRVQQGRDRYWVSKKYIKLYDDCPTAHTKAVEVCTKGILNFYETEEQILEKEPSGQFEAFQNLYRDYGNLYSKKVMLKEDGSELSFVPVKKSQTSREVFWVAEAYVPSFCGLDVDAKVNFRGRKDSCTVRRKDNFPLNHPAQFDYYTGSAMFGAGRIGTTRKHGAVDLYSFSRGTKSSKVIWGTEFHAIDDGEVVSIQDYGRQTKRITIQSEHGYTWNFAEVGRLQVKTGDPVDKGDLIGTTRRYVLEDPKKKYPPMLHTEKFDALIKNPRQGPINTRYTRNKSIENPSCHIEYMEKQKNFNQ